MPMGLITRSEVAEILGIAPTSVTTTLRRLEIPIQQRLKGPTGHITNYYSRDLVEQAALRSSRRSPR